MPRLELKSKAKTLEDLSAIIMSAKILPLYRFYVNAYKANSKVILEEIKDRFAGKLIVRSSSSNEDNFQTSNAGGFESIMNVDSADKKKLQNAIDHVVASYGDTLSEADEIFVQPMLQNVSMSGVIFSADIDTLSPYYIINYDESGSTTSVTSGTSNDLKTYISLKGIQIENDKLSKLVAATKECEEIFDNNFLDIEFAYSNDELYILQVRAIVTKDKDDLSDIDLLTSLNKLHKKIDKLNAPHPNLLGHKSIYGVMPDWNPAEIIGVKPKRLALSLYKELITDETWAYQRDNYGYRNLRSHPLLLSFLGVPYIDVRVSFNSFIPKTLDEKIATKLANYYLDELSKNINHHDKVEFEVIFSCFYFGVEKKLIKLEGNGFSKDDLLSIKESLLSLTNNIIDTRDGLYKKDLEKVDILKKKFDDIVYSDLALLEKIYWLIKDVKRFGTLPFAGVARAGFIAVQILKSFVDENILSEVEYDSFLNSLNTVSKELSTDINTLCKESFLKNYGHLRPGTYDILSSRYDESYDEYFGIKRDDILKSKEKKQFTFSPSQVDKIEEIIVQNRLNSNFYELVKFIKESIEGREYVKFIFTRHLSQILVYVEEFGKKFGFTREDLAYLDIQKIINLYATLDHRDVKEILEFDISKNKEFYRYTKAVKLPNVIVDAKDIFGFFIEENEANFVTLNKIESMVVIEENISVSDIEGKVICIRSADPGYDYLFAKNIGGLITCYGGANSHMAIRCAEMGIPAVIGCGESNFEIYSKANIIEIDALSKQVKVLS